MDTTLIDKPTKTWRLDINHTGLHFKIGHLGLAEVRGSFTDYQGIVETQGDLFESANVKLIIKSESINTSNTLRDNHLRSSDFFDVANYPEVRFHSTGLKNLGDSKYLLEGNLIIKDISKQIVFDTTFKGLTNDINGNEVAIFMANGEINRFDYDLKWHPILENGFPVVSEKVLLDLIVEMHRIA